MRIETAVLADGRKVKYCMVSDPPCGGMKCTYFAPDRSYVVQFYHDQSLAADPKRMARLEAILGRFNPTTHAETGAYFQKLFCWPTGIVVKPRLGVMCPTYPANFLFQSPPFAGREKEGTWFVLPKPRSLLSPEERGTWINYFQVCILIARAVRRLHQAGLAHSDLSSKNILIDPSGGQSTVIDIDSLVVPDLFPPDVVGTPGYIAPEVISTLHLPIEDARRRHPSARTDQHALAVLLYEYLLLRHPLRGPKVRSTASTEDDERLAMGEEALFVEHPSDPSNRPADLTVPYTVLGPYLGELVLRAFVRGLHTPEERPTAMDWERALVKTWDLKIDCQNPGCPSRWFVLRDAAHPQCPFCGTRRTGTVPLLRFRKQWRPGEWQPDGEVLVVHEQLSLFQWHAVGNIFPGEKADRTPQAYCVFHQGRWLLVNQNLPALSSPSGNRVQPGQAVELADGARFQLSEGPHGKMAEVQLLSL